MIPRSSSDSASLYQTELKFTESIDLFSACSPRRRNILKSIFSRPFSYLGLNQFEKAITCFEAELATPKPHPRTHYYFAITLLSLGRSDDAVAQFDQSLAQNPNDLDALYRVARLHMNASLATIQKLTDLDPDSFQLHALMGEVYANNGRFEDSLKEYRAAWPNARMLPAFITRWEPLSAI